MPGFAGVKANGLMLVVAGLLSAAEGEAAFSPVRARTGSSLPSKEPMRRRNF